LILVLGSVVSRDLDVSGPGGMDRHALSGSTNVPRFGSAATGDPRRKVMSKYVVIYTGLPPAGADRETITAAWRRWFVRLGDAVVDAGNPFAACKSVAADGSISDGGTRGLTGYSILQADDLSAAAEMVKGCPGLANATIEVYETVPFG